MFARVLVFLWPFLKEMLLDDKTIPEAMSQNKKRLLIVLVIFVSLGLNFFALPKLVHISKEYLDLKKKYEQTKPIPTKPPVTSPPHLPVAALKPPKPQIHHPAKIHHPHAPKRHRRTQVPPANTEPAVSRYRRAREDFERIRAREARAGGF